MRPFTPMLVLTLAATLTIATAEEPPLKPLPYNVAEAMVEPFYDYDLSGFLRWRVQKGPEYGLKVYQNWCTVNYEWASKPADGLVLHMGRDFNLDCTGYDVLIVSGVAPEGATFHVLADTDVGELSYAGPPSKEEKEEHRLDLAGATRIHRLTLEVRTDQEGVGHGWLNWVLLEKPERVPLLREAWEGFDTQWSMHLKPESYEPKFEPQHGILINTEELEALRARHDAYIADHGESLFTRMGERRRSLEPERAIMKFAKGGGDNRFNRIRDHEFPKMSGGDDAALAGIVDYGRPIHLLYKHCQRHNMLVPTGLAERPHPPSPLEVDITPKGSGDDTAFHATMDVTPGWEKHYKKWTRTWDSPTPNTLTIRDEYERVKDGPVEVNGPVVTITGKKGIVRLTIPKDCTVEVEELPAYESTQHRIAVTRAAPSGILEIKVDLSPTG